MVKFIVAVVNTLDDTTKYIGGSNLTRYVWCKKYDGEDEAIADAKKVSKNNPYVYYRIEKIVL